MPFENRQLVRIGQPHRFVAPFALESCDALDPGAFLDQRRVAARTLKRQRLVEQVIGQTHSIFLQDGTAAQHGCQGRPIPKRRELTRECPLALTNHRPRCPILRQRGLLPIGRAGGFDAQHPCHTVGAATFTIPAAVESTVTRVAPMARSDRSLAVNDGARAIHPARKPDFPTGSPSGAGSGFNAFARMTTSRTAEANSPRSQPQRKCVTQAYAPFAMSLSRNFWIFPVEVFGISANITALGTLKRASRPRQCSMISASVAVLPGFSST